MNTTYGESGKAKSIVRNPHFWAITALMLVLTYSYYAGYFNVSWLPYDHAFFTSEYVHDLHRVLFLIPMLYAAMVFRLGGALVISIVVFLIVLPRGLYISLYPTPLFRAVAFVAVASLASMLLALSRGQRDRLKEERDFTSALVDTEGAIVVVFNKYGEIVRINQACEETLGYSFDDIEGKHIWDLCMNLEDAESYKAIFLEVVSGEFPQENQNYWVRQDGDRRLIMWSHTAIPNSEGLIEFVLSTGIDITKQRQAEERIVHLNLVLRAIRNVNHLITHEGDRDKLLKGACASLVESRGYHNVWAALLDEKGKLVMTVEAGLGQEFLPMLNMLKQGEFTVCDRIALNQADIVITKDPSTTCVDCPLASKYEGRSAVTMRFEYGGKVYGLLSASLPREIVEDKEEQDLFRSIVEDIAFALRKMELEEEHKRVYEEIRRLNTELEQRVRQRTIELTEVNKELEAFSYSVSHDLRAPLRSIDGFSQALLEDYSEKLDEQGKDYLQRVRASAQRMGQLIDDLLGLSRITREEMLHETVNLSQIAQRIAK
ncbi:MAG: PAS domain S-box protein, partial [Chloroflexota bacterium]|nr:PAS domain S-box protein [Chloroflexota bacterium]